MNTIDDSTLHEWMDLELDGDLEPANKALLTERLAASDELRAEQRCLTSLRKLLDSDRIAVRDGLPSRVMSALPEAAWEQRSEKRTSAWAFPAVLAAAFGAAAALLLSVGGAAGPESQVFGLVTAVADFFATTLLAGSGLLFATWRGAGFGLETIIVESGLSLVAMASLVIFLNLLFFSLLRRRRAVAVTDQRR